MSDREIPTRLGVAEAVASVLDGWSPLGSERIALGDAIGRVLAMDVASRVDLPPWDNASMDGYAVRASDVLGASDAEPIALGIVGAVAAGGSPEVRIAPGKAVRIATGAPVPADADAVVRIEDTDRGRDRVRITNDRDARGSTRLARNVRPRGEDARAGANVAAAGTPVTPALLGVLASIGAARLDVVRKPRVAFLSSGDELVDVDGFAEVEAARRIVSSNSYTLPAMARAFGAEAFDYGVARDTLDAVRDRVRIALASECDVLVTSGGISVGEHDHTREALAAFDLVQRFWRVRMRPGGPFGFGAVRTASGREIPWLGLPGNPVSAMVTFEVFGRPLIRRLAGHTRVHCVPVRVTLAHDIETVAPLTHFLRATVVPNDRGELVARLTGAQGSNLLTSMAMANALLIVPEEIARASAGESLQALILGDLAS